MATELLDVDEIVGGKETPKRPLSAAAKRKRDSKCIVVDTLNLSHAIAASKIARCSKSKGKSISVLDIAHAMRLLAPKLRKMGYEHIMFVVKDQERQAAADTSCDQSDIYAALAKELKVIVYFVEKLESPSKKIHAAQGRDDFYMSLLAEQFFCKVLTADNLRDFAQFREAIEPFTVTEHNHWRSKPLCNRISPVNYPQIRKPLTIKPSDVFSELM